MSRERVTFAPGIGSLAELGVRALGTLFEPDGLPSPGAELVARERGGSRVRWPLPGTPDARGKTLDRPGELGTGWVLARRFHGGSLGSRLGARLSAPRSLSLGERWWNVACLLREAGVGTPQLLAVGARGKGLVAGASFVAVRETTNERPLDAWLEATVDSEARALGLEAVRATLERIERAAIELPALAPSNVLVGVVAPRADLAGADCAGDGPDLPKRRLPGVLVSGLDGARLDAAGARHAVASVRSSLEGGLV